MRGKVAIVTGGAQGLGLTTVEAFLQAGAHVAIFDRHQEALERAASEIAEAGYVCLALLVDVRHEWEIEAAVDRVLASCGRIDVLVNNAALLSSFIQGEAPERPPFWEIDPDRWRELWDVNVCGLWLCTRRVARQMIAQRSGSIINITSTAHILTSERHIPYGPSKAAVEAFTRAGARQLQPYGVRMNALLPGAAVNPRGGTDPRRNPPDVLVPAALFLASDESAGVTGQSIIAEEYIRELGRLPASSPRAD
ncbi:MAG TPA: SDR family oxidoreductase [bacterium]|nr:SDR family oxidoreductase [bacterium]